MSIFNIEQIRQTIDSIQKKHPAYGFFDVTKINDENAVVFIKNEIDKYMAKATQDTDIYIICEMAKQYINGVRPTVEERPTGEWLEDSGNIACSHCHTIWLYRRTNYCPNCGAKMKGGRKNE